MRKIQQAVNNLRDEYSNGETEAFVALYNMLGATELHDGIVTAMEDEGHGEYMEDLLDNLDILDNGGKI